MNEFSFVEASTNRQTTEETLLVLTYEVGNVIRNFFYDKRYGTAGYKDNMKTELSDVISMVRMLCELEGWNFEELMRFGEQHYLERQEDLREYGMKEDDR